VRTALITAVAFAALAGAAGAQDAVPLRRSQPSAAAPAATQVRFKAVMDSVFGPGKWRETGGYRTPEREAELRAEGALTVRPGAISQHSRGRPGAPGAYDAVVEGLGVDAAAARLRRSGAPFRRIFAEGAHGTQGAHLHLEPFTLDLSGARSLAAAGPPWTVSDATPAQVVLARLRGLAQGGDAQAQLRLGVAYAEGRLAPRDLVAAYVWTAAAGANPSADPVGRHDAEQILAQIAPHMKPDEIAQAQRFAPASSCAPAASDHGSAVIVLGAWSPAPAAGAQAAACPAS